MKYVIRHESAHGMRIYTGLCRMSLDQADLLEYYLLDQPCVESVKVYERTGDAVISWKREDGRAEVRKALDAFSFRDEDAKALVPEHTGRALNREYEEKLVLKILGKGFRRIFFPAPLRMAWDLGKSIPFFWKGLRCLRKGRLEVPALDATAIAASMLRGDFDTASSVMFLLDVGELLEEWTHKKSVDDLARTMSLKVDSVWLRTASGEEVLMDVRKVQTGDEIVVRTSNVIPLDGQVLSGEMTVNQASMTGESAPVFKSEGGYVYAGTVVEEGECVIRVTKAAGTGKYDQIVKMIEESEKLKSAAELKAYHLADRLVPWSLLGAGITWLLTRNVNRALSFLMVDFSCALKLSMPLSVLSAIREASTYNISFKGGTALEAAAQAETIVFDKTGTLTHAVPKVVGIETFTELDETECLRIAACLEEHYPHSMANAVVEEARSRGISHEEMHSSVKYVVAHGIASEIDGRKVIIGSEHFVFEDEGCSLPAGGEEKLARLPDEYSHLYLAIDGVLTAVICVFDPLREEAAEVIDELHRMGFTKICMMTGDNEKTAAAIAARLHIDEYHAGVLPEDKAEFIRRERAAGRKVIMVGDGVNDTPALSEADAGVAISDGAALARDIADIIISDDSLYPLLKMRAISQALMHRIDGNYRFIISFNAALIALGVAGILPPASSALLHNGSTILSGLKSMTDLLPAPAGPEGSLRRTVAEAC